MTQLKYKLTDETITHLGFILYRIELLSDCAIGKKGKKGGFIEKLENLSQYGNSWVYDNAKVFDNARVFDNAKVFDNSQVSGNSRVYGDAWVYDNSKVSGNSRVYGNSWVSINSEVYGKSKVYGNSWVSSNSEVSGNSEVFDNARVFGNSRVYGNSKVFGNAQVFGNARIKSQDDILCIFPIGSENGTLTAYKTKSGEIELTRGCFCGSIQDFLEKLEEKHKDNNYAKEYKIALDLIKLKFGTKNN